MTCEGLGGGVVFIDGVEGEVAFLGGDGSESYSVHASEIGDGEDGDVGDRSPFGLGCENEISSFSYSSSFRIKRPQKS